ncbi:MAG TPA: LLM class flavin-dependent oxidoreductase [Acidimicrobiia bacterium]
MEGIPDPALVVLIGPSGSGKSTWAARHFRTEEVVSSDRLRAMVGSGEHDLDASATAFSLLDQIVEARMRRGLMVVVDTLGLDDERRARQMALARELGLPAALVVFDVPEAVVRQRNRERERPVPASVLTSQIRRFRQLRPRLESEGWEILSPMDDLVITSSIGPQVKESPSAPPSGLRFYLQLSRFAGKEPLAQRLVGMARSAEAVGFSGLALMDHLVQIPQVGREWEDLPEAYTALSYVAAHTTRLEVGTLVSGLTLRQPALLAKMIATLDVLSGGRVFCGLGLGWFEAELRAYGYSMASTAQRRAALEDMLQILPLMWGPGKATFRGKVHSVVDAVCYPRPAHPIKVIVGGSGDRTIELAARLADGVNLRVTDQLEARVKHVVVSLERARKDRLGFEISVLDLPLIGSDRADVASRVEKWRGRADAPAFSRRHHAGDAFAQIERFGQMAALGVDVVFVAPIGLETPADVELWAPVVGALART